MPVMDAAQQAAFFRAKLGSVLPPLKVAAFESDLLRVNLAVMDAALRKVAATAGSAGVAPRDARGAVWSDYSRRIAELHQLYPLFFTFESAWRTLTAEVLRRRYGDTNAWWHPIRSAVQASASLGHVSSLGGVAATNEVIKRVENILRKQRPGDLPSLSTSYDLVEASTLADVGWFIDRHWSTVASLFGRTGRPRPTSSEFAALFKRVRDARNAAYHHRPVSHRQRVVDAAEQLLDLIDVHLDTRVRTIAACTPAPFTFSVPALPRHG